MAQMVFNSSPSTTLGVEIEVAIVDAETMALHSGCQQILEKIADAYERGIKPELMQCYIEVNSKICANAAEAEADLRGKFEEIQSVADGLGMKLCWAATHS